MDRIRSLYFERVERCSRLGGCFLGAGKQIYFDFSVLPSFLTTLLSVLLLLFAGSMKKQALLARKDLDESGLCRASPAEISWDRRSACPYDLWQRGDAVGIYALRLSSRAELMLCSSWSSGKSLPLFTRVMLVSVRCEEHLSGPYKLENQMS